MPPPAVFAWLDLHRQVRMRGHVERVDDRQSDEYFATRPRDSQVAAWASPQSDVIADRGELERRVAESARRFTGAGVPRPPFWGGWRLIVDSAEFWQGRPNRLHDRCPLSPGRGQRVGDRTPRAVIDQLPDS